MFLKRLAATTGAAVLAACQLNRQVESRTSRMPQLHDLRDSGSIEQDADVVMFLSRGGENDKEPIPSVAPGEPQTITVSVAKHRNGACGSVELDFLPHYTKFGSRSAAQDWSAGHGGLGR